VKLPNLNISVIYRSDGSGTTYIFSHYLSKISNKWADKIGSVKSFKIPIGTGAVGNSGVAGIIKQTEGAFGYIGSEYAFVQKIPFVKLQNESGKFIDPSVESINAAAKGDIPSDARLMLTNSSDPDAYPISAFTWIILYREQAYNGRSFQQAEATLKFLKWVISPEAQALAKPLNYAPLSEKAVTIATDILESVTYNGKPVLK